MALPEFIKGFFRLFRSETKPAVEAAKAFPQAVNDQITDAVTQIKAKAEETTVDVKNKLADAAVEVTEVVAEKAKKNVKKAAKKIKEQ